jgi:hypothetical protein
MVLGKTRHGVSTGTVPVPLSQFDLEECLSPLGGVLGGVPVTPNSRLVSTGTGTRAKGPCSLQNINFYDDNADHQSQMPEAYSLVV